MVLQFHDGYRSIAWFSTRTLRRTHLNGVQTATSRLFADATCFLGICFGKFDFVVDFWNESAKVSSYLVGNLQRDIKREASLPCLSSLVLCKEIVKPKEDVTAFPVRTYTFIQPTDLSLLLSISETISYSNDRSHNVRMELLHNNTLFPLVLMQEGLSLRSLAEHIRRLRKELNKKIRETSTFVGLRLGQSDKNDESLHLQAITFLKLQKFGAVDRTVTDENPEIGPVECIGWFDIMRRIQGDSLKEIQDKIFDIREEFKDDILLTSTQLLYEGGKMK